MITKIVKKDNLLLPPTYVLLFGYFKLPLFDISRSMFLVAILLVNFDPNIEIPLGQNKDAMSHLLLTNNACLNAMHFVNIDLPLKYHTTRIPGFLNWEFW
jgi:hypothetical protein